ncbi:phasin family protein [Candidatus Accumulibacter sp. ACC003]|uniref:phasin family protein n=1 Tax=Candidatus Accumulibacter sp. ACC003 TaxID=2823334 RepID=UPI0025B9A710|nr:phasin family protein [Candidatus Accumulibacter sp. ACC003]
MLSASPDLIGAVEINTKAFMTLSKLAFSNLERLSTLNLNATRAALAGGSAAVSSLGQAKGQQEQPKLLAGAAGAAKTNAADYLKGVQEIAAETQKEVSSLITSYFAPHGDGSNPSAGWLKGFEQFKGFAQQITDMTAANAKVAGDVSARIASSAASLAKKDA